MGVIACKLIPKLAFKGVFNNSIVKIFTLPLEILPATDRCKIALQ